ncbi:MAG: hypothetical protein KC636_29735, partial [Myxococcales bacterium]|nr:hypothetical protein [Myxococcales bacterium]
GGVGKTTVAAALGIAAARSGRSTLVVTIDPARRLADALGLRGLDDRARAVPLEAPGAAPLSAAMLDPGASYDALVDRITGDADHRRRILGNRVYQVMSRSFGASHAYVAMERLHEAIHAGDHDLVILDTPPTRNALDILDAPGRLASFLDEGALAWLVRRASAGPLSRLMSPGVRARGGAATSWLLSRVLGEALTGELLEFFELFLSLRQGLRGRAEEVTALLRAPSTAFVLTCAPRATSLADAAYLRDGLAARGVSLSAAVFNAAFTSRPGRPHEPVRASTRAARPGLDEALARLRDAIARENAAAEAAIDGFALPEACARVIAPRLDPAPRTLAAVAELGALLTAPTLASA